MSDSTLADGASLASSQALVHSERPKELELYAVEGAARWLGRILHPLAFRFMSMIEQRADTMSGPVTPNEAYFRRDRHRHPRIDPQTYRLEITGVARPRTFTLDELRAMPWEHRVLVMECAGNGNHVMGSAGLIGQARWSGPSVQTVLAACGGPGAATHFAFHGQDPIPLLRRGYHYGLSLEELTRAQALLALEMNGEPLPRQRGFPVRMVAPGIYSMSHVKWLGRIEGKSEPHLGIHNRWVFTNRELRAGKWVRVQARWIGLKSMVTRCQRVSDGWVLSGWAWGGDQPIERVAVTTDGGVTWCDAEVHAPSTYFGEDDGVRPTDLEYAWSVWSYHWRDPSAGTYRIASRAWNANGHAQPMEPPADVKGHFNQTQVKWRRVAVP
jgi:DMSO/TMAO reductase YedYZ molybdopterin-dependent catalytic subunit